MPSIYLNKPFTQSRTSVATDTLMLSSDLLTFRRTVVSLGSGAVAFMLLMFSVVSMALTSFQKCYANPVVYGVRVGYCCAL